MAETFTAIGTWVGALALIATAVYAARTIEQSKFFERIKLTVNVLEASYTLSALASAEKIFKDLRWDLEAARQYVVDHAIDPEVRSISGTYCYIAGLYARGVLDAETIFSKDASTIVVGFYALHPLITLWIESGFMTEKVCELARDALARMRQSPQFFEMFPALKDYRI